MGREILEISDVATVMPGFAPYEARVLEASEFSYPGAAQDIEAPDAETDPSQAVCICRQVCDANFNACALWSFSCGPYYALCAGVCYQQYGGCIANCGY